MPYTPPKGSFGTGKMVYYYVGSKMHDTLEEARRTAKEYANEEGSPEKIIKETTVTKHRGQFLTPRSKTTTRTYIVKPDKRQGNPSLTLHIPPKLAGKIKIRTNGKGIRVSRRKIK